jgi:hypothetical protein
MDNSTISHIRARVLGWLAGGAAFALASSVAAQSLAPSSATGLPALPSPDAAVAPNAPVPGTGLNSGSLLGGSRVAGESISQGIGKSVSTATHNGLRGKDLANYIHNDLGRGRPALKSGSQNQIPSQFQQPQQFQQQQPQQFQQQQQFQQTNEHADKPFKQKKDKGQQQNEDGWHHGHEGRDVGHGNGHREHGGGRGGRSQFGGGGGGRGRGR